MPIEPDNPERRFIAWRCYLKTEIAEAEDHKLAMLAFEARPSVRLGLCGLRSLHHSVIEPEQIAYFRLEEPADGANQPAPRIDH